MDLIFFGMQGAGKGTLGKAVAKKYGLQIFETGAELRKLSQADSDLGKKIKSIIEAGHLVSNEVVMEIVENFMNNNQDQSPILFDGIPRKLEQAQSLNQLLEKHQRDYTGVFIDISRKTALARLTTRRLCSDCGKIYPASYQEETCQNCSGKLVTRKDDNPEAIETRLKAFEEQTLPAIQLYSDNLININGELDIEGVKEEAFEKLDKLFI